MRGRFVQHFWMTLQIRFIEVEIVCEGVMDIDEGYFEIDDIYLSDSRKGSFKLPKRILKYIRDNYDECIAEKAWSEL